MPSAPHPTGAQVLRETRVLAWRVSRLPGGALELEHEPVEQALALQQRLAVFPRVSASDLHPELGQVAQERLPKYGHVAVGKRELHGSPVIWVSVWDQASRFETAHCTAYACASVT